MNDDDLSTSTSRSRSASNEANTSSDDSPESPPAPSDDEVARLRLRSQQTRRAFFLDNLRRNIDIVIYCQLSIIYYMDCSLLRFFLRTIPHWILFTPKPAFFPAPPSNRPYVSSIVITNGFCALVHLLASRPEAGEATRGYLHGGLLINFVGELGPISRWRMVLVDIFIVLLQLVVLGVILERRHLKSAMESGQAMVPEVSTEHGPSSVLPTRQDLDAEEQGIRRSQEHFGDDIELSALKSDSGGHEGLVGPRKRQGHALDAFYSGQVVIVDVHFQDAIRTAWRRRYGA